MSESRRPRKSSKAKAKPVRQPGPAAQDPSPVPMRHGHKQRSRGASLAAHPEIASSPPIQQALQDSQARLQAIVNSLLDTILVAIDLQGRFNFIYISPELEKRYGLRTADLAGKNLLDVFPRPEAQRRLNWISQVARTGQRLQVEVQTRHPGGLFWQESTYSPCFGPDGVVNSVMVIIRDVTDRKAAETALRASEERYRDLFENNPLCVFEEDLGAFPPVILRANAQAVRTFGFSQAQFAGMPVEKIVPPEAVVDLQSVLAAVKDRGSINLDSTNRRSDGSIFPVRVMMCVSPVLGPRRAIVTVEDITQEQQAAQALRQSKEQLQYIIDNTWEIIFQIDLAGHFSFGNQAAERITGYSLTELIGLSMFAIVPPEYHEGLRLRLEQRQRRAELPQPFKFEILDKAGRRVMLEVTTTEVVEQGKLVAAQGIARNVTGREQAEAALRESERRMRLVLQHSSDGINIVEMDPQTSRRKLMLCNDRYVQMSGRMRDELMAADNLNQLVTMVRFDQDAVERERRKLAGEPWTGLASWKRPDGQENHYEWTASAFWMGGKMYAVGSDRDVTNRLLAQRALQDAQQRLAVAREEERRHLAGELHDSVGQGMVALQLGLRALWAEWQPGGPNQAVLRQASAQVDGLIREVRSICHGLYPPTLESLGLHSALHQLARDFAQTQVNIDWQLDKSTRFSRDVEITLFRIAQEAMCNAIRHGRASRIDITVSFSAGRAAMGVVDNGQGFDVSRAAGGLGLSMMQERAGMARGELKVDSAPGRTCVHVSVPAEPQPPRVQPMESV